MIEQGKWDYKKALEQAKYFPRKELLCVHFLKATEELSTTVIDNIKLIKNKCDWALVLYDGDHNNVSKLCNNPAIYEYLVFCERSADTLKEETNHKVSTPKTVLYHSLLPLLPKYKKLILMDEDISLDGFDMQKFLQIWKCSFTYEPLIVQPLISESNQYLLFVNAKPWKEKEKYSKAIASTVGYIEQQVPAFDSIFFEWFVRRVLVHTKRYSLHYGIDWGHDRSWCNAAKLYVREVLNWPTAPNSTNNNVKLNDYPAPCALVTSPDTYVHHLNKQTMKIIRGNPNVFRKHAFMVVQKYVDLYPTWVGMDMLDVNNPLDSRNDNKFKQVTQLNSSCISHSN